MTGLNMMKGGSDPVAMADSAYPSWLWQFAKETPPEELPEKKRIRKLRRKFIRDKNSQLAKR